MSSLRCWNLDAHDGFNTMVDSDADVKDDADAESAFCILMWRLLVCLVLARSAVGPAVSSILLASALLVGQGLLYRIYWLAQAARIHYRLQI